MKNKTPFSIYILDTWRYDNAFKFSKNLLYFYQKQAFRALIVLVPINNLNFKLWKSPFLIFLKCSRLFLANYCIFKLNKFRQFGPSINLPWADHVSFLKNVGLDRFSRFTFTGNKQKETKAMYLYVFLMCFV